MNAVKPLTNWVKLPQRQFVNHQSESYLHTILSCFCFYEVTKLIVYCVSS